MENFSIDYSTDKHRSLTSSKSVLRTYSRDQAHLIAASQEVAREYIQLHRAWHREYINDRRPNPVLYEVGDRVFARRSILSGIRRILHQSRYLPVGAGSKCP